MKEGEPFGLIRLEAEQRFDPKQVSVELVSSPEFVAGIWETRYGSLTGHVRRLEREVQVLEIHSLVKRGALTYQQGERMAIFLDLERLGLAQSYYSMSAYRERRRQAVKVGLAANDGAGGPLDVDLESLLRPYATAVSESKEGCRRGGGSAARPTTRAGATSDCIAQ